MVKNIKISSLKYNFKNSRHNFWADAYKYTMQQKWLHNFSKCEAGLSERNIGLEQQKSYPKLTNNKKFK